MKNDVREHLIHAMFSSLYHEGYHACNLNDLLKRAGSSKGGLYHYFGSKQELALASIESVLGNYISRFWMDGIASYDDPISAVETLLQQLPEFHFIPNVPFEFKYGSPLNRIIQELSAMDDEIASLSRTLLNQWIQIIAEAFEKGQKQKSIRSDIDALQLAHFIVASIEGSLSLSKALQDGKPYYENIGSLVSYLTPLKTLHKPTSRPKKTAPQSLFD